jgi:hypothetical protein
MAYSSLVLDEMSCDTDEASLRVQHARSRSVLSTKARARLVAVLRSPTGHMAGGLEEKRARAAHLAGREDVLWYVLLQSMSTLQSSAGHVHIFPGPDREPLPSIAYGALQALDETARQAALRIAFCKVRFGKIRAERLALNFEKIERMGGLNGATATMRALRGIDAKKAWITRFHGIGKKYARNFWMDIRDPDFANSIAVDSRLMSVGRILGMNTDIYEEQERFFLDIAKDAGISGWEADRLIYNHRDELLVEAGIDIPWKKNKPGDWPADGCRVQT